VALKRSQIDVIDVMLEHGANPQGIVDGESFIVRSSVSGNVEVVQSLLKAGANPNSNTNDGLPILFFLSAMVAMKAQSENSIAQKYEEIIKVLLQAGASPNAAGPGGFTPLHIAGEIGNLSLIMSLLEHGADPQVRNIEQQTPADVAAEWGHVDATKYLLYGLGAESIDPAVAQAEVDRLIAEKKTRQETTMKAINSGEAAPRKKLIPAPEEPSEEKYLDYKTQGNKAFVSGDYNGALDHYQQALRHKTTDSTLWSNAAAAAIRLERYDQAMNLARIARTVDNTNVKAWYREGKAAESLQLWEDAATAYYEAFLVNNESPAKLSDVDFAELVKSAVQKGREENQKSKKKEDS
jgi:tetratricopeptide (TPR) repeat protein